MPAAPGFPLQPCRVATASEAIHCGRRYALPSRPAGGTGYPLSPCNRSIPRYRGRRVRVAQRLLYLIGSKEGIAPSSAHRSRTSPIKGMRLQQVLGCPGWHPEYPVLLATERVLFRRNGYKVGGSAPCLPTKARGSVAGVLSIQPLSR
ncbi:MAG: hypothetical protein KGI54_15995 [Pseudomonadota bacterium]|nr:hypothetical protein [Pseudomonadota bacterium]